MHIPTRRSRSMMSCIEYKMGLKQWLRIKVRGFLAVLFSTLVLLTRGRYLAMIIMMMMMMIMLIAGQVPNSLESYTFCGQQ